MTWLAPAFEEINMSAEIGGYQGDYGDGNTPPVVTTEGSSAAETSAD
jgi:hypothetical protein